MMLHTSQISIKIIQLIDNPNPVVITSVESGCEFMKFAPVKFLNFIGVHLAGEKCGVGDAESGGGEGGEGGGGGGGKGVVIDKKSMTNVV